ncbi:MAG: IS66 family transposase [Limisphaerales bacterium]
MDRETAVTTAGALSSKSIDAQAIDYALKRREALTRFVADGILEIDNNLVENAIRPVRLGKRTFYSLAIPKRASAAR